VLERSLADAIADNSNRDDDSDNDANKHANADKRGELDW
jgi:hypothetical protein